MFLEENGEKDQGVPSHELKILLTYNKLRTGGSKGMEFNLT